ncbi:MAG: hypothetical protein DSY77_15830, partial [Bacteroidetes bacterium]
MALAQNIRFWWFCPSVLSTRHLLVHQIKALTQKWMEDYNTRHPHSSIGDMPPREYKNRFGEEFFPE